MPLRALLPVRSFSGRQHARRRLLLTAWGAALAALVVLSSSGATASNPYLEIPPVEEAMDTPAYRYANMSNAEVLAELDKRNIPYRRVEPVPGVRLPLRLEGRLHGVWIHSVLPAEQRKTTPFEILDGRLALALDDFCAILEEHGFVELIHFTMYRPPQTTPDRASEHQHRHPGGMAIDVGALKKRGGHWMAVGPHWPGQIGAKSCSQGGRALKGRRGRELLSVVCEAADQRLFHYMLTPHFNQAHADHLHLEVKTGVKWFLVN